MLKCLLRDKKQSYKRFIIDQKNIWNYTVNIFLMFQMTFKISFYRQESSAQFSDEVSFLVQKY